MNNIERQLLLNQNLILAQLHPDNAETYSLRADILRNGYAYLYDEVFEELMDEKSEDIGRETHDILSMYRSINNALARLAPDVRDGFQQADIAFEGFDGNNDPHYGFANFIVSDMELYDEYNGHIPNSHTQASLPKYRRMLEAYGEFPNYGNSMGIEELNALREAALG